MGRLDCYTIIAVLLLLALFALLLIAPESTRDLAWLESLRK